MINKEIIENNTTFILRRPEHINTVFIYFGSYDVNYLKNLTPECSEILDKIEKTANLVFIFDKKLKEVIKLDHFSSLYRACGYIVSDHSYPTQSIWYALTYFRLLYERMAGFVVIMQENLSSVNPEKLEKILLDGSLVNTNIFKRDRLSLDKMREIYLVPEKRTFWEKITKGKIELSYSSGINSRFTTTDNIIILRPLFIDESKKFIESERDDLLSFLYLESFYTRYPGEFFSSIVEYLPKDKIRFLDIKLEDCYD